MLAAIVDTDALFKVVLVSLTAGLVVTAAFSTAIAGAARFSDMRRAGRPLAAGGFMVMVVLAMAVVAAALAVGIVAMTTK